MADPALVVEDVDAGYGGTEVLDGVSLTVDDGEVVALIGRNGAGKTTTLRAIIGTITPDRGTVRHRGADITSLGPVDTVRHGVVLVPEDRRPFATLTVREDLRLARMGGAADGEGMRVAEVLDTFGNLRERADNPGATLSGGEQQMLAIARGLVGGADLLLLDEPTEGLAPSVAETVRTVVDDLNEAGRTILLVEQNMDVAVELADRVYVIDRGEIVYHGTPEELQADEEVQERYLTVSA